MKLEYFRHHTPQPIDIDNNYGVLIPFIKIENKWHLLFEMRSSKLRRQPGEICFPGGRLEKDETAEQAAIRETCEELGIKEQQINLIGPMDFLVTTFGDYLRPYVAILEVDDIANISFNRQEVASVFVVPISYLVENEPDYHYVQNQISANDDFPYHRIGREKRYNWRGRDYSVLFYQYQDKVIWGMTAKIVERLCYYLKSETIK